MVNSSLTKKRLLLLRHATAKPSSDNGDIGRTLAPNGVKEARSLGAFMLEKSYIPDVILCSPARRTRETLEMLQESVFCKNISTPHILYDGSSDDYLNEIQHIDDKYYNILLLAHNPSIHALAALLVGHGHDASLQRLASGYAPATLSVISCACTKWANIQPDGNELSDIASPIDYNA